MGLTKLIKMIRAHDPSVRSVAEIFLYQGFWAIFWHKIAHRLYKWRLFFLARFVSQFSRLLTKIEIHPGATINTEVFIDHGTGVVIGETAVVGRNVVIFHGATLGGTGKDTGKRHPTVEDDVMIGANATIIGPITVGKGAKIGANAIVVKDVPPGTTIVGEIGRDINQECSLRKEIDSLRKRVTVLEQQSKNGD